MIHLRQISKNYGEKQVLRNITHSFAAGSATAFVGHNGCGKSTLLKVLAGLVTPTRGEVRHDRRLVIHYVPERFPATHLTAKQYLTHMGMIDGLPRDRLAEEIRKLAGEFHMEEHLRSKMTTLSKGTLQKVGVIQALLVTPDVLLLDEPLSGQDAEAQRVFTEKVNELRGRGVTLFMSCHEPELVAAVTEKSYTIEGGQLLPCREPARETYRILLCWEGRAVPGSRRRRCWLKRRAGKCNPMGMDIRSFYPGRSVTVVWACSWHRDGGSEDCIESERSDQRMGKQAFGKGKGREMKSILAMAKYRYHIWKQGHLYVMPLVMLALYGGFCYSIRPARLVTCVVMLCFVLFSPWYGWDMRSGTGRTRYKNSCCTCGSFGKVHII